RYLDAFPDSESAYRLRFYYAEILYALEEWEPAGDQYARVADADPKGDYAQKAAYDAVLALEKAVAIAQGKLQKRELRDAARIDEHQEKGRVGQGGTERVGASKGGQEEPVPQLEQKLIGACGRYLRLTPKAPGSEFERRVAKIAEGARFKHALEIYEKRNDPVLAAKEFTDFVARYPRSEYAPVALNDSVVIAEKAEQLDLVIAAAEQLLNEY